MASAWVPDLANPARAGPLAPEVQSTLELQGACILLTLYGVRSEASQRKRSSSTFNDKQKNLLILPTSENISTFHQQSRLFLSSGRAFLTAPLIWAQSSVHPEMKGAAKDRIPCLLRPKSRCLSIRRIPLHCLGRTRFPSVGEPIKTYSDSFQRRKPNSKDSSE